MQIVLVYIMLFSWPLVASWLFSKLKLERAVIWGILLPYMILPVGAGIDLPLIPVLDKTTIPNIVLLFLAWKHSKGKLKLFPESIVARALFLMMLFVPFVTSALNSQPLIFPQNYIPGLTIKDAIGSLLLSCILMIPLVLGRCFLGTAEAHRDMLKILVAAGLVYSVFMLIEIRLSPQLHTWIYGYFPHEGGFIQQVRQGGYRPVVFMGHGLLVALFAMFVVAAAAALWRDKIVSEGRYLFKAGYMFGVLVLCKTLGALLYALLVLPLVLFSSPRTQLRVALILVLVAVTYPALRGAGMVPVNEMLNAAQTIDEERARSLDFRFTNEEALLERASERPLFGWGSWGRNHIRDPITGDMTSVTDGYWIIVIGVNGWIGYLATFGLLAWPILTIFWRARREVADFLTPSTGALCLLLAINVIDFIPNAALMPLTWLIVGSLIGYVEQKQGVVAAAQAEPPGDATVLKPQKRPRTIL
jgi:hypothetical protein